MAPPLKSVLYNQLKLAREMGRQIPLTKPYVSYTESELQALVDTYLNTDPAPAEHSTKPVLEPPIVIPPPEMQGDPFDPKLSPAERAAILGVAVDDRPTRHAGRTFYSHGPNDPVRVDSNGLIWYRDEVRKPAIPKPRDTRTVRQQSTGFQVEERRDEDGRLIERFETAGDQVRDVEIKITMPSWQVGIYRDPRMPFRVHVYEDTRGFDFQDLVVYFGGIDLIPSAIKRIYVGGDLCFDISSTRNYMEQQFRDLQLGRSFK